MEVFRDRRGHPHMRLEYDSCRRCGLVIRSTTAHNGSPLCPDCRKAGEKVQMVRGIPEVPSR